ncbi:hypothetical protein A3A14_01645 [Candidatus Daviesbacteria bacterium RIFCSPLOWO2_01_FULL_43_38]|uniref:DUF5673 domain-containing protein n=2 Tax=Candidatus Daviesiibacteriota TaxID=1752718 RepID=A0A1F5K2Y0_9BACT|nr:MAG: hypothetical protein UV41_C0060G0003 [Candidatus Daviesbacteria bacterium GW2011_GWA2_42_7]OGE19593.1 MAG: hypothetical protein A2874_03705 [Candidatus Daviesbacteria bacterium RIFCSPHIGHO2_01_FULL_43_17]OGE35273.1 MAG: hypothetical protein A3E45_03840 [Candidatus Daviesbacteria bacterium RIFCSPHIGHO2_12_FULL_43_11]OGE63393.1 MAG: hypothetical protein A3A14_01645 [Candidatus Daviesbacteria bacterium RIFCSPLOWO2_01_FULL_43_38]OGE69239.1 MAG: hypothetical protein A3J21_01810 [Candidatus D
MPRFFVKNPHPKETSLPSDEKKEDIKEDLTQDDDHIKTFLTWTAASRPYRKKDRSYFTTVAIIVILLILISILAREFLLVGVLLAFAFVIYVLGFVPPEDVEYKISGQGITIGDHFYFWDDLDSFWFSEKDGQKLLYVLTNLRFPAQLMILLGPTSEEQVKKIVARFLPFQEIPPRTLMDKWAEGLQKHFPLENPHR